jgi:hypothetical protein
MENFISVALPSRKAKKAVLEKMIASAQMHLNETNPNYGIFEDDNKNIILKIELPQQLDNKASDAVAHNLSENLFNLGYNDFDIEISSNDSEESTLENTDWHTAEAEAEPEEMPPKEINKMQIQPDGSISKAHKDMLKRATTNKTPVGKTGAEPGSEQALMAIVNQYAKPGMTLADVDAMERAAVASEVPSASADSNIFSKAFQGFKRFAKSKDWRVKFVLANAAEKEGLPGLFNSRGSFIYMADEVQGDEAGGQQGGPSSAAGTNLKSYMALAKRGLLPQVKIEKIQKAFANRPDDMKQVNAIVAAQQAATSQVKTGPVDTPKTPTDPEGGVAQGMDQADAATSGGKFDDLSQKEASQLLFDKLKQLRELMRNNPEPRSVVAENKKILMRRLHNNYMFEDLAADKSIAELIADIELLMPKVSDANRRIATDAVKKASPYVRRYKAVTAAKSGAGTSTDKKDPTRLFPALDDFSKSGKGGLANDPDEQEAIKELQEFFGVPVTGKYDQATKDAVVKYQAERGLSQDGDAGPNTIGEILSDQMKKYKPADVTGQDNNPNKDGGQKSDADQRKADAKKDLKNGVAPEEEQLLKNAIKFNWKKKSYYVSVTKVEKNEANNNISWVFYKDDKLTQGQKVATLGSHWEAQLEKELKRRADAGDKKAKDTLEILNPDGIPDTNDPKFATSQTGGDGDTDADVDAGIVEDIFEAVDGMQTDETMLFDAIAAIRDNAHYKTIARMFKKVYPGRINSEFPTLAIWMRDDLESWWWDAADLKKFDREMNRLGINIKKPIPPEKVAKGETVKSGNKTVVGTAEPTDKPRDGGNPGGSQSSAQGQDNNPNKDDGGGPPDADKDKRPVVPPTAQNNNPNKDDGGGKATDDKKDTKKEPKALNSDQVAKINQLAQVIYDTNGYLNDDEKGFKNALSNVKTPQQYKKLDATFIELEDNDDKESIEDYAKSMFNSKELEKYYYSELRRIKVPHKIKVFKVKGKVKVPKGYDDKGNFIIKKGSNAK